jgi:hypothetical protein
MCSATICSAEPSLAKSDGLVSKTGGSRISRTSDEMSETMTANPDDWRTPLVHYLEDPGHIADRKVRCQALKYVMLDNTLFWKSRKNHFKSETVFGRRFCLSGLEAKSLGSGCQIGKDRIESRK